MTIKLLYTDITTKLYKQFGKEESSLLADRIIWHFFHFNRINRVLNNDIEIDEKSKAEIDIAVINLLNHMPIQYVLGVSYFLDYEFKVSSSVLIPRSETEELVMMIFNRLKDSEASVLKILDIGTGSGCIAVSLAKLLPKACVTAIDISKAAIGVAKQNAMTNNVQIDFLNLDILKSEQWLQLPDFDVVISNPPYVTEADKANMQPNVLDYEPAMALYVSNEDPLVFYKSIVDFCQEKLSVNGLCAFEINEAFGKEVMALFNEDDYDALLLTDMQSKPRFVIAKKKRATR